MPAVTDPRLDRDALAPTLRLVADEATRYLTTIDEAAVGPPCEARSSAGMAGALPEQGSGSLAALRLLIRCSRR